MDSHDTTPAGESATPAPVSAPAPAPASEARAVARGIDRYLTPLAVLVGAVIIAGALVYGHTGTGLPGAGQQPAQAPAVNIADVKTAGEPFLGNANAPTTVAFFYDYQCPFCKQFELNAMPTLLKNYVDTGKTKVVLKDFQFLGPDSNTAALFARAVWHLYPGQFQQWYTTMFNTQAQENSGWATLPNLEKIAAGVPGIDVNAVVADMNANQKAYQAAIDADRQEGAALGVNGTPSVIVGKQLLTGYTPEQFISSISSELDKELKK